ncbi:PREDICTED: uncharacterized protein LOC109587164 [Amphimedon queenslandica]|uniref:PH domain-containing protein n=1 Tax=Amphimedon queenslandica TaxID=400682 RepID=A0A1X7TLX9_AMPQE|nr:PREDICTED: uncharacterized protein LOC109587164 [Amphimedon queenslandica]|eukprot:XP_019858958.1 PREDICTED: uncharacterized protein LOC109587164 [Amphimedon queenslandica]
MATADFSTVSESVEEAPCSEDQIKNEDIIMSGFLTKEGGVYRTWKKRHFVLEGTSLRYYKKEGDTDPKGTVDLTEGRGVRTKDETSGVEWPDAAKKGLAFGLAVTGRTYYFYGSDPKEVKKWKEELSSIIDEHGEFTSDWENDSEGLPEPAVSKMIRGVAKFGAGIVKKFVKDSGLVDEQTANIIEGAADAVQDQAEADHNTSLADRAKMAVGDGAGIIGDNVDNQYVSAGCAIVKEQAEADDDTTLTQRAGMALGTGLKETSGLVDNEIVGDVMKVGGGMIHDQAEADPNASIGERIAIGVGGAASGVGDCVGDDTAKEVLKGVGKGAEKVNEKLKEKREKEEKEEKKKKKGGDDDKDDEDDDGSESD